MGGRLKGELNLVNRAANGRVLQAVDTHDTIDPDVAFWRDVRAGLLAVTAAIERRYGPTYSKAIKDADMFEPEAVPCTARARM